MRHHAFITSAQSDAHQARQLHAALRRYRIPAVLGGRNRGGSQSRFDIHLANPGSSDIADLTEVQQSDYLIVICSRESARDATVDQHLRAFKRLGRPHNILTFIANGEPNAADGNAGVPASEECFPEALKYGLRADGSLDRGQRFEPIAADARPHKDGRHTVVLKIAAGLLGTGFDDLYRRDERRQHQRLYVFLAVSFVLTAFLGVLAVRTFLSDRQSRNQLASTRAVNAYIESLFANVDRPALQKMDPKLMALILNASEAELDRNTAQLAPEVEEQMRRTLGQAYLACGLWDRAIANLQRCLPLEEAIAATNKSAALTNRRDLGEALIGAGKPAEACALLSAVALSDRAVIRYQLARALALTGDPNDACLLLQEDIKARPQALALALQEPAFASIHSRLLSPAITH